MKNSLQNLIKTLVISECLKSLQVVKLTQSGRIFQTRMTL